MGSFDQKRKDKLPMHTLMQQKSQELTGIKDLTNQLPPTNQIKVNDSHEREEPSQINELEITSQTKTETKEEVTEPKSSPRTCDINLNEIQISMPEINPNPAQQPLVMQTPDTGVAITLHFTKNIPSPGVSVAVISLANHSQVPISDIELRVAVTRDWRCKLLQLSSQQLAAVSVFSPPATTTGILLLAPVAADKNNCKLSYFLSYNSEGETVSEMGKDFSLPEM